jgi:hypothetical protein
LRGACRPEIVGTHSNSECVLELFEQNPLLFGWQKYNSGPKSMSYPNFWKFQFMYLSKEKKPLNNVFVTFSRKTNG